MYSGFLAILLAAAGGAARLEPEKWPGGRTKLESLVDSTAAVAAATAAGPAEIVKRYAAHLSTAMADSNGRVIHGGGMLYSAECQQKFRVFEVLHGPGKAEDRVLEYSFVEKTQGFPLPSRQSPIPNGVKVLLLFDAKGNLLKALLDTPENRRMVKAVIQPKEGKEPLPTPN